MSNYWPVAVLSLKSHTEKNLLFLLLLQKKDSTTWVIIATIKHGNNLRQLLNDHTIVKVKFNTQTFGTLEQAFTSLRDLAVESGASQSIELIEMKQNERTIIFGLPGTKGKIQDGSFPPPPPPPYKRQPEETTEDDEQSDE